MRLVSALMIAGSLTLLQAQFVKDGDIVKDTKSGLMWQDNSDAKSLKMGWHEAQEYCKKLELNGIKGWELPGFGQLFSIVDTKVYNPTLSKTFENFVPDNYWSTKTFSHGMSNEAFVIEFKGGAFNRKKMDLKFNVRCYKKP